MKLAFIGGGVMGEAMIGGVLRNALAKPADVAACDVLAQRRDYLASTYGITTADKPASVLEGASIVVLAVKPQEFPAAARSLSLKPGQTVMSIMAGVTPPAASRSSPARRLCQSWPASPSPPSATRCTTTPSCGRSPTRPPR